MDRYGHINGPTSAIIHSPDGLSIPKLSEMYLEAHTISFARCLVKGDDRVAHVINSKLARESTWKRKMQTFGSRQWNNFYQAANKSMSAINKMKSKWKAIKNNIKNELENYRTNEWRQRVQPLSVQGRMLELISDEKSDLTWRSIIYNLPTGVLSFAVRSCIDFLPTFTNLRTWGREQMLNVNSVIIHRLFYMFWTIVQYHLSNLDLLGGITAFYLTWPINLLNLIVITVQYMLTYLVTQ